MGLSVGAAGNGILLKSGRAVIPVHSDHWGKTSVAGSAAMYSDNGGQNWSLSHTAVAGGNECQIAQAPNGSLIMTTRGGGWLNIAWSNNGASFHTQNALDIGISRSSHRRFSLPFHRR